jgi:EmrB/QacA subfamily drug resistance transporter
VILAIACLGQFMVILDVAIVNVALPSMRRELEFSTTGLQWVVNAYTLAFAGFLLLGGRTADLFGRRRMFLVGLGVFTAASMVCGLAPNAASLIGARAVQGMGAAILSPVTLTIVTMTFVEPRERSRALGVWSAALASGGAVGVLLGGILTDLFSWRWIFLVNIPVGIAGIVIGRMVLRESRANLRSTSLDVAGALSITAALSSLVFGIVETTTHGWSSPLTLGPIVASVILGALFLLIEARLATAPIVPLGILRSRALTGANISMACVGGSMFAMWYFVSLYLQEVLGMTPLDAGLAFIPAALAIVAGSQFAGRVVPRTGPRSMLVGAGLVISVSLFWMSHLSADGSYFGDRRVRGHVECAPVRRGTRVGPGQQLTSDRRRDRPRRVGNGGRTPHRCTSRRRVERRDAGRRLRARDRHRVAHRPRHRRSRVHHPRRAPTHGSQVRGAGGRGRRRGVARRTLAPLSHLVPGTSQDTHRPASEADIDVHVRHVWRRLRASTWAASSRTVRHGAGHLTGHAPAGVGG